MFSLSFIGRLFSATPSPPTPPIGLMFGADEARDAVLVGASRSKHRRGAPVPEGLKPPRHGARAWCGRSDALRLTAIPSGVPVRPAYMRAYTQARAPVISCSSFVPPAMVAHLMRHKKDSALGVKFIPGDTITLMEGAMHTFVTPLVRVVMHGDYRWKHGHEVVSFGDVKQQQLGRDVILSAAVHPDFETHDVMRRLAMLNDEPFLGRALNIRRFKLLAPAGKQDDVKRTAYDASLKQHMVAHLTALSALPARQSAAIEALSEQAARKLVESAINDPGSPRTRLRNTYVHGGRKSILSLELLFNTYIHMARNELSALEQTCPQGYVYTYDPPAIFARTLGASLLNRLQIAAWRSLSEESQWPNMRVMGFNDYADPEIMPLLRFALRRQVHVSVMPKADLFKGAHDTYLPPASAHGAMLVLHNNSDGFGQNIETEGPGASMDGAIGSHSSAAAALHRAHPNLLYHIM